LFCGLRGVVCSFATADTFVVAVSAGGGDDDRRDEIVMGTTVVDADND
jgi:hypothetical protein